MEIKHTAAIALAAALFASGRVALAAEAMAPLPPIANKVERDQGVTLFKTYSWDELSVSGFVASRRPDAATTPDLLRQDSGQQADYRTYLGVQYRQQLGESASLSTRTFYGAGTYNGDNSAIYPGNGALPGEVQSSTPSAGNWVGADWQVTSRVFERHEVRAGVEYREPLAFDVLRENTTFGREAHTSAPSATRTLDFVTGSRIALAQDLTLNANVRVKEEAARPDGTATPKSVNPRVELQYKPAPSSAVTASFNEKARSTVATDRVLDPSLAASGQTYRVRNYELAYEQSLAERDRMRVATYRVGIDGNPSAAAPLGGAPVQAGATGFEVGMERRQSSGLKTGVSYAWQQTSDFTGGAAQGSIERRLTKVNVGVPVLARRFSTGLELQYQQIADSLSGPANRDLVIGNLTFASGELARKTRFSLGLQNIFDARDTAGVGRLPYLPQDGRSLRMDLTRKF